MVERGGEGRAGLEEGGGDAERTVVEGAVERGPPALAVARHQGRARVHESGRDGGIAAQRRRVEGGDVAGTASVDVRAVRLEHARQTSERLLRGAPSRGGQKRRLCLARGRARRPTGGGHRHRDPWSGDEGMKTRPPRREWATATATPDANVQRTRASKARAREPRRSRCARANV